MTSTTASPRDGATRRRGRTRGLLLDAAFAVFAERGVHAASVEEICERAGFTRGAFYSNFSTKEELFFALMARENEVRVARLGLQLDELAPRLRRLADATATPEVVAELGSVVVEILTGPEDDTRWCLVHSEFELLALRDPAVAQAFMAHQERYEGADALAGTVERGIALAGRRLLVDSRTATRLLVSVYESELRAALLAAAPGTAPDPAVGAEPLARLLIAFTEPLPG